MSGSPPDARTANPLRSVPLLWFVVGLPLVVVVAAFVTLVIAVRSADDVVRDDFRKEGLAIYADPSRDAAATTLGVAARFSVDPASGAVHVELRMREGEPPQALTVVLSHATRAELDRMLTLRHDGVAYEGQTSPLPAGRWYVEITPPDRGWRLKGDFRDAAVGIELSPPAVS